MWKEIKGYENYSVNGTGEVKNNTTGNFLKSSKDKDGYLLVSLYKNGKGNTKRIHRLVAESFIENPYKKITINHKNGIRTDNRLENLEWMTHGENQLHAFKELGRKHSMLNKFGKNHHSSKEIIQLTKSGCKVKSFYGTYEAQRETGISQSSISRVCCGKLKTAGGFIWEYKYK